jgi:hypothetical protein
MEFYQARRGGFDEAAVMMSKSKEKGCQIMISNSLCDKYKILN